MGMKAPMFHRTSKDTSYVKMNGDGMIVHDSDSHIVMNGDGMVIQDGDETIEMGHGGIYINGEKMSGKGKKSKKGKCQTATGGIDLNSFKRPGFDEYGQVAMGEPAPVPKKKYRQSDKVRSINTETKDTMRRISKCQRVLESISQRRLQEMRDWPSKRVLAIVLAIILTVSIIGICIFVWNHSYTTETDHTATVTDKREVVRQVWHPTDTDGGGYYTTEYDYYLSLSDGFGEKKVTHSDYDKYDVGDTYAWTETNFHWG